MGDKRELLTQAHAADESAKGHIEEALRQTRYAERMRISVELESTGGEANGWVRPDGGPGARRIALRELADSWRGRASGFVGAPTAGDALDEALERVHVLTEALRWIVQSPASNAMELREEAARASGLPIESWR